jgi:hypothetical protein
MSNPFTIKKLGRKAYRLGLKKSDCPISHRTNANGIHWWSQGWDEEEQATTCKGTKCSAKLGIGHSDDCEKEHALLFQTEDNDK